MKFVRSNAVRIVIGAVLLAATYCAICVFMINRTDQWERLIARRINSDDGEAALVYCGPMWLTKLSGTQSFFQRIDSAGVAGPDVQLSELASLTNVKELIIGGNAIVTDEGLKQLKALHHLEVFGIANAQVTDFSLSHLAAFRHLKNLDLGGTQITDAGLVHLKGLTKLRSLYLVGTLTTPTGRTMLRKALPDCKISPDP